MKIHFVHGGFGGRTHLRKLKEMGYSLDNYLMSYHYIKDDVKKGLLLGHIENFLSSSKSMILDSGSFSAFNLGSYIDIDEYTDFIKQYKYIFTGFYAGLDVIGDPEKSIANQNYMESKGIKPLPTYHYGEDIKYLDYYLRNYDYVGIGGLVPLANQPKKIEAMLNFIFGYIKKHNLKTKLHGRGMTNPRFIIKFPFYSIDSSGRIAAGKFNRFMFFDEKSGTIKGYTAQDSRIKYGIDPAKLEYRDKLINGITAYSELEKYADRLHTIKGLKYWE